MDALAGIAAREPNLRTPDLGPHSTRRHWAPDIGCRGSFFFALSLASTRLHLPRDPLQLHLVLRPGDRHPLPRRGQLAADRGAARHPPHRALGADAVRGARRHVGGHPQPLPAGRPARGPQAPRPADRRAAHRLDQFEQRLNDNAKAANAAGRGARRRASASRTSSSRTGAARAHLRKRLAGITRKDNVDFGGLARVSHATDATDWRVEMPFVVICRTRRTRSPPSSPPASTAACRSSRAAAAPATPARRCRWMPARAVINTEKLEPLRRRADGPARRGSRPRGRCPRCAAAPASSPAGSDLADANGLAFAVDPTSQDASCIGGNVAMNAGGKKAVLWGTALDNLASWRMVTPDADWLTVERLDHNLGKIHDAETVRFRVSPLRRRRQHAQGRARDPEMPGSAFRKLGPRQGRDRQVPLRPARRAEGGLRRPDHLGPLRAAPDAGTGAHRLPGVLRHRPGPRRAGHRRDQGLRRRPPGRCRSPAWSTWTSATCAPSTTPPRPTAASCRRWCCSPTWSPTTRTPWPRSPMRWSRSPTPATARASSPSAPRRASASGSTAPAPRPSRAHQRLQDQRGRGHPAGPAGRLQPRHRAHQHRAVHPQQGRHHGRGARLPGRAAARGPPGRRLRDLRRGPAILDAKRDAARELVRQARARWQDILRLLDAPAAEHLHLLRQPERARWSMPTTACST
jgi:hypothetical protein